MGEIIDAFQQLPLFAPLSEYIIRELANRLEDRYLEAGEALFDIDDEIADPGDSLYIVKTGSLKVFLRDAQDREMLLVELGPLSVLGEISLIDREPRAANVTALTDTKMLRLSRDDFLEVMSYYPPELIDEMRALSTQLRFGYMVKTLAALPLFQGLPDDVVFQLADKLETLMLEKDEALFYKGDPGDALYVVNTGRVKIVTEDARGEELVLNRCGPGDPIGEMSLLDKEPQPRSAGVIALSPVRMLVLKREYFIEVLGEQPTLALDIMRNISTRLRFATTYIEQAIEWSNRIAEGNYGEAMDQIQTSQMKVVQVQSDEARATELLSAFFSMVKEVQEREEKLKSQLQQLTIQIDQARRQEDFEEVTKTDFFMDLKAMAQQMRDEHAEED